MMSRSKGVAMNKYLISNSIEDPLYPNPPKSTEQPKQLKEKPKKRGKRQKIASMTTPFPEKKIKKERSDDPPLPSVLWEG